MSHLLFVERKCLRVRESRTGWRKKNTAGSLKTDSKRDSSAKVDIYGTEDLFFSFLLDCLKILAQKLLRLVHKSAPAAAIDSTSKLNISNRGYK